MFDGRALSGPAGGAIVLPRPSSRYKGKERVGNREGEEGEGREGREGVGRNGKGG